jgi:GNAT superfamily N-acetyltransferase
LEIGLLDLRRGDADVIAAVDGGNGWNGDPGLWARYLTEQQDGRRVVVIAWEGGRPMGYGTLVWEPGYERFRAAGVPEINNLAVDARVRRQGVATALIRHFEDRAREAGRTVIGLGVGLYADYGPAQRLYFRLGYGPDGHGITYADRPLAPMETVRLDDDLVLWLSKAL